MTSDAITFECVVYKVGTLADNGIRATFDLNEQSLEAFVKLAACQQAGAILSIVATPIIRESLTKSDNETKEETEARTHQVGDGRTLKRRNKRTGGSL